MSVRGPWNPAPWLILSSLLFFFPPGAGANPSREDFVIRSLVQLPKIVYVGDRFDLVVLFDNPEGAASSLPKDEEIAIRLPHDDLSPWTIDSVSLERDSPGYKLLVSMRAWKTGRLVLSDFDIAGRSLRGVAIEVSSVLDSKEGQREPAGARGSILPPGTRKLIFSVCAILSVLIVFLLIFKRHILPSILLYRKRRPRRRILARMRRLIRSRRPPPPEELLCRFVGELRALLSLVSSLEVGSFTAPEFSRLRPLDPLLFTADFLEAQDRVIRYHDHSRFSNDPADWHPLAGLLASSLEAFEALDARLCAREEGTL